MHNDCKKFNPLRIQLFGSITRFGLHNIRIGLYLCNQSGGSIEANTVFYDASSTTLVNITHNTPIPSGTSIAVMGGDAKVVLEAGDSIRVQSNVASSIDVVLSYLEQT